MATKDMKNGIVDLDSARSSALLEEIRRYDELDKIYRTQRPEGALTMQELLDSTDISEKRMRRIVAKMVNDGVAVKIRGILNGRTAVFYRIQEKKE